MLAGALEINNLDLKNSKKIIKKFRYKFSGFETAIDLAGGVGRTVENVLMPCFK